MELGTGIFLSTLVISIVLLYGITKDRWKWRHLLKRAALVCLGLMLFGALVGAGAYLYHQVPTALSRQIEYVGLRLGMSPDEVLYIKGYPPNVLAEDGSGPWKGFMTVLDASKLENGKTVKDFRNWSYNQYHHNINVAFNDERTVVVAIQCYSDDKLSRCPAIADIDDGDDEQKVLRTFGNTTQTKINGVTKSLTYPELGVKLYLTKEHVYLLEVSTSAFARH